jgi:hypothetical protein
VQISLLDVAGNAHNGLTIDEAARHVVRVLDRDCTPSPPTSRAQWVERLRSDIANRIALLVGYSAGDADFRPLWPSLLAGAREVIWFDLPDTEQQERKRRTLRDMDRRGSLSFPIGPVDSAGRNDPTQDFAGWITDNVALSVRPAPPSNVSQPRTLPGLPSQSTFATARFCERLGDARQARRPT